MSHAREKISILVVAALGVVFGDIGTSPLYAVKVCFTGQPSISATPENVLGLVSLIFWSVMLVVSLKYALFILRADDNGEGGVFAMLAMLHKKMGAGLGRGLILAGLFGSALLYGDGLITPVISVLSALEGLEVATSSARPVVVPMTCCILVLLFWAQSRGTGRLGKFFGPIMILWFAVIALAGAAAISRMPVILEAVHPVHGLRFFSNNGLRGFFLLGVVVLCVTGCEALYADMGHFGAKAIRISWYFVALPALLLNYFGQGALILLDPTKAAEPFFGLVPRTLLYPMVLLATTATIVASQAIISGVFSLTRQAIQLGFLPRMRVVHTSGMAEGQVYLPDINTLMMAAAIVLALYFKSSDALADAYGIAVTGTMLITSVVFYFISRWIWNWSVMKALPLCLLFWVLDFTYFSACLQKFTNGGWFPLCSASLIMVIMVAWWDGWKRLGLKVMTMTVPRETFMQKVAGGKLIRLPGTGVFLSTFHREVPPMLIHYVNQTGALYEKLVILSVLTSDVPEIDESKRIEITGLGHGVYRVTANYGFMEAPDIPQIMSRVKAGGLSINLDEVTYYLGRISLVRDHKRTMPRWRRFLFTFMLRNSLSGSSYLNIPPSKVMEIGVQMRY
ncbi:MAG TPA: KUP/HAK/KT family potassium transporter [Syntrophobacteraceae bacterium]|nr:KUP/HAK/KT family potassium transporter [Syntrophobacteraceae bacterium]